MAQLPDNRTAKPLSLAAVLGGLLALALGLAILPAFARPASRPMGYVVDASLRPMAHTKIVVHRDGNAYRVETDANGGFTVPGQSPPQVEGYALAEVLNHTGQGPFRTYYFGPIGTMVVRLYGRDGKRLDTPFSLLFLGFGQFAEYQGNHGEIHISDACLGKPEYMVHVSPEDLFLKPVDWRRRVVGSTVNYDLTFERSQSPAPHRQTWSHLNGRFIDF